MTVKITKPQINVREKISELDKPSGVAGQAMLAAETPQEQFNLIGAGRRNMLINANMTINQRGTASPVTVSANDNQIYPVDRWRTYANSTDCVATINDVVLPNGHRVKSLKTVASGSGAWIHPFQTVEIESWMSGQTVTFSAWIRTNFTNQAFRICDGVSCYLIGDEFPSDGQWHYMTASYVLPNGMTTGFMQYHPGFGGACVANDYIEFACPQMELGKVATPFEYRQIAEELALCQRYYQRFDADGQDFTNIGIAIATNSAWYVPIILPGGRMRADPALSYSAVGDFRVTLQHSNTNAVTSMMIGYSNPLHPNLSVQAGSNSASNGARMFGYGSSTTAWLAFDAEL